MVYNKRPPLRNRSVIADVTPESVPAGVIFLFTERIGYNNSVFFQVEERVQRKILPLTKLVKSHYMGGGSVVMLAKYGFSIEDARKRVAFILQSR